MGHMQANKPFQDRLEIDKRNINAMEFNIQRINRRILQLQMTDQRTITTSDSQTMMRHWTVESHKSDMFIAPKTSSSDIARVTSPDDHRKRDYHFTLRHTEADSAEPIPLIHWLMAHKDIYEKCLATLTKKKRPGSQKQRAPTKRPALENPPTSMFTMFLRQQQMTQLMMEQFAPQAATGLMDPNWTATAPLTIETPAARGPGDLRNYLQVNRAVQTPQQASHGQSTLQHPIRTQGRGRGRNPNRNHRGRQQNRNIAAPQSNRRRARQNNMPEPGQGNRPK